LAQTLFSLDPAVVQADLGVETINGADITTFKDRIPDNVALGVQQCLDKCGLKGIEARRRWTGHPLSPTSSDGGQKAHARYPPKRTKRAVQNDGVLYAKECH
jgi:hypothetical protein